MPSIDSKIMLQNLSIYYLVDARPTLNVQPFLSSNIYYNIAVNMDKLTSRVTYFIAPVSFYTLRKCQKTNAFLMFSGVEKESNDLKCITAFNSGLQILILLGAHENLGDLGFNKKLVN